MPHVEAIQHAKELLTQYNHYVAIREILADEQAWQNLKDHNRRIFAALEAVLLSEPTRIYPTKLYDNVYSVLVFFTKCWPRNEYDHPEGQPRGYQCVFTLDRITKPVYTATGLIMDAKHLPEILKYGKNPLNRRSFSQRDVAYMKVQALQYKIAIPKNKQEKYNWRDIFLTAFMVSTFVLIVIGAFVFPPFLSGLLPLTIFAAPLLTTPFSYLFTNFWFNRSTVKKTAGYSDKIEELIALTGDSNVDEIAPALPREIENDIRIEIFPEYEIDQPGLLRKVGEPDHPELSAQFAQQPQNVVVNANSNRRQGMLSWLNKIEPSLHSEAKLDEQPGLSIHKK